MNKQLTVKEVCERFQHGDKKAMRQLQRALDEATGVKTIPLLQVKFLPQHDVSRRPIGELLDLMTDAVKTAVARKVSAGVYPIEIALDGTMTLPPDEVVVKFADKLDFSNWGSNRLGVAVVCDYVRPLAFRVLVGPFFELTEAIKLAVDGHG